MQSTQKFWKQSLSRESQLTTILFAKRKNHTAKKRRREARYYIISYIKNQINQIYTKNRFETIYNSPDFTLLTDDHNAVDA